jgi:hypothetical protein
MVLENVTTWVISFFKYLNLQTSLKTKAKVKQSRYRPGVAQRVPVT